MNFIGIDLHTSRFTCCYRTERPAVDNPKDRHVQTFELIGDELAAFYATLTVEDTLLKDKTFRLSDKKILKKALSSIEYIVADVTESPINRPKKTKKSGIRAIKSVIP